MANKPTLAIENEGITCLPDLDGRDHVPDQLEIDLGDGNTDGRAIASNCDRQVGLRAAIIPDLVIPDSGRASPRHGAVTGAVSPALGPVQAKLRDIQPLPPRTVNKGQADDPGCLADGSQ